MCAKKNYNKTAKGAQRILIRILCAPFVVVTSTGCMKLRASGQEKRREMKQWAEWFYKSKQWIQTREAYLISQSYLCERCGEPAKIAHHKVWLTPENIWNPEISLNWSNLEALCQDCHNKEHHEKEKQIRYRFADDGSILPPI